MQYQPSVILGADLIRPVPHPERNAIIVSALMVMLSAAKDLLFWEHRFSGAFGL